MDRGSFGFQVHAYTACPNDQTAYLAELRSGKEVVVVNAGGQQRTAIVGRVKDRDETAGEHHHNNADACLLPHFASLGIGMSEAAHFCRLEGTTSVYLTGSRHHTTGA